MDRALVSANAASTPALTDARPDNVLSPPIDSKIADEPLLLVEHRSLKAMPYMLEYTSLVFSAGAVCPEKQLANPKWKAAE